MRELILKTLFIFGPILLMAVFGFGKGKNK